MSYDKDEFKNQPKPDIEGFLASLNKIPETFLYNGNQFTRKDLRKSKSGVLYLVTKKGWIKVDPSELLAIEQVEHEQ